MIDDFYFYQDSGKTIGPVSGPDLKSRIREGKLRLFDLILKEGEAVWRMALEHAEFKEDFKGPSKAALKDKPWVCLQRKSPDGFDFMTTGPYSLDEIREGLMAGRVSYTDYVWRSGFNEWKRIGLIEDFNPRLRKSEPLRSQPLESAEELIRNVVELKRPKLPEDEPPPPEARGPDLTKPAPPPVPVDEEPTVISVRPSLEKVPEVRDEVTSTRVKKRRRKSVPWVDWGIVVILVVVLGAVALVLSRNIKRQRTLEVPANTVVETVPPTVAKEPVAYEDEPDTPEIIDEDIDPPKSPPKAAEEKPSEAVKKTSRAPTELVLSVKSRNNTQARVDVRTNGTAEFPVFVQVIGLPGQVTSGASFYRYVRLKPTGDFRQPLDFSKVKLPQGRLIFRARTGDLKREAKLNLGVNDPAYKQSLKRVRKLHAYSIWSERLSLLRVSGLLADRIGKGGKLSPRGFEVLNEVRVANGYKYALFDDWFELKDIYDEARKQSTPALAAKARRIRDKMLSFSIYK